MGKGPKVEWDAKHLRAKGASDLASIVKPTYRAGYSL
jgi:hypothetical protein